MSSAAGLVAAPHRAAYVSSKHGVIGLTKEMALELAGDNIQVNAVAPGVTEIRSRDPEKIASGRALGSTPRDRSNDPFSRLR
jgi:3-hydroxybutyrate dehydrogenase